MTRIFPVVGVVLVLGFPAVATASGKESHGSPPADPPSTAAGFGKLNGVVTAGDGVPLGDVLVTLAGPGGASLAVSDAAGHFRFDALPAGRYLLRTHGSGAAIGRIVRIDAGQAVFEPLVLEPSGASPRDLVLAGSAFQFGDPVEAPEPEDAAPAASGTPVPGDPSDGVDAADAGSQDRRMWWLRRARRSVLKDRAYGASLLHPGEGASGAVSAERWASSGQASLDHPLSGVAGLPISGEIQFLTRATLTGPSFVWPSETWPGQVAYVSVAPSGAGDWALRGTVDMSTGETSSWAIAGWYSMQPTRSHDVDVAVSYSRQAHAAAADLRLDGAGRAPVAGMPHREVGRVEVADTWAVSPVLDVGYGAELARYGYLDDGRFFSPRASVTLFPDAGFRVRAAASRNLAAPGGEQFLPPLDGLWLPPERTYSSLSGVADLRAEQVRHVEIGIEHDIGERSVIGVRRVRQQVDNQLMALFAPGSDALPASGGHYYLAGAGGVDVDGWGVTFEHALDDQLRGAFDYRIVESAWAPPPVASASEAASAMFLRNGAGRFHDVTASVEAEIPETSTRVLARCRVSTAYARMTSAGVVEPGFDTRFDVQVTQTLPYAPFEGSSWELLVALRSLFHEPGQGASIYDELLVVDPPRQLVGGLVVHF